MRQYYQWYHSFLHSLYIIGPAWQYSFLYPLKIKAYLKSAPLFPVRNRNNYSFELRSPYSNSFKMNTLFKFSRKLLCKNKTYDSRHFILITNYLLKNIIPYVTLRKMTSLFFKKALWLLSLFKLILIKHRYWFNKENWHCIIKWKRSLQALYWFSKQKVKLQLF